MKIKWKNLGVISIGLAGALLTGHWSDALLPAFLGFGFGAWSITCIVKLGWDKN